MNTVRNLGATTGLHGYDAPQQHRAEGDYGLSAHASTQHDPSTRVPPDEAATVLAEIDPQHSNGRRPAPFLVSATQQG